LSEVYINTYLYIFSSLANNRITRINTQAFNSVTVSSLDLRGNPVRYLHWKSFDTLTLSETLWLNSMNYATVPRRAFHAVTANNVKMGGGVIDTIEHEAFYDVTVTEDL